PGCMVMESISNPLLRVGEIDRVAGIAKEVGAALVVDNTFATPLLARPLESHADSLRALGRTIGGVLGPFECYLTMRGIKTFPLRMERQCANARQVASCLAAHPRVERVYFTGDPRHPDAAAIERLFPAGLYGAMVSFEIKDARREEVFRFMDALEMIVRATSLGD